MRKILTIIFALVLFVLAILIQLDLITILTVTATSLNATPTSVYVLWTILLLFENLTYSFFINNATIILLISNLCSLIYFTLATIALNASGWFTAKSANTLRLISIPALCKAPINLE